MTLPKPDRPSVDTTIETIVDEIKENLDYLDSEPSAYVVKMLTLKTAASGNGTETVTGIGFEPRIILLFSIGAYGQGCLRYYGPSTVSDSIAIYKYRTFVSGSFYKDRYQVLGLAGGYYWNSLLMMTYDSSLNRIYGRVSSVNSDGFVWTWVENSSGIALDEYYVVALCIK